jgi:hypothetical protein
MRICNALAAALLVAVPLAGCSSGDDDSARSDPGEQPTEAGDGEAGDGEGSSATSDAGSAGVGDTDGDGGGVGRASGSDRPDSVREDFAVPFPSGWVVDIQGDIGLTDMSGAQLLYPNEAYDDVVAFYDDWVESQPDESARTDLEGQIVYQLLGEVFYQITVIPDHEERDETWTLLQVSGGAEAN